MQRPLAINLASLFATTLRGSFVFALSLLLVQCGSTEHNVNESVHAGNGNSGGSGASGGFGAIPSIGGTSGKGGAGGASVVSGSGGELALTGGTATDGGDRGLDQAGTPGAGGVPSAAGAANAALEPPPCPLDKKWINCASDCGGVDQCYCQGGYLLQWTPNEGSTVRLPFSDKAFHCPMQDRRIVVAHLVPPICLGIELKVSVAEPWRVSEADAVAADNHNAGCDGPAHNCRILTESSTLSDYDFWFVTDDPNAPPANATIEIVPYGSSCN